MKMISLSILSLIFSLSASATNKSFNPCTDKQLDILQDDLQSWHHEGYTEAYKMLNLKKEIVGIYVSDKKDNMQTKVCENLRSKGSAFSSLWNLWTSEDSSSLPTKWKLGNAYQFANNESTGSMHVISTNKEKKLVKVIFVVNGSEKEIKRDFLTLKRMDITK